MIQLILMLALTPISTQSKVAKTQPKQDGPVTTCQWPNTCVADVPVTTCQWPNTCASEEPTVQTCQYPNKCS